MDAPTLYSPIVTLPPKRMPIFLGKASPGARIKVCKTNARNEILAEATADANGSWLVRANKELPFGNYSISAYYDKSTAYAPNLEFYIEGPELVQGDQIPSPSIEPPAISTVLPVDSASIRLSTQSVQSDNSWLYFQSLFSSVGYVSRNILFKDEDDTGDITADAPPTISTPANNSSVQTLRPTLTGKAAPNGRVCVHNDAYVYYGDCYANANGDWSYTFAQDLAPGKVTLLFGQFTLTARLSADTAITLTLR